MVEDMPSNPYFSQDLTKLLQSQMEIIIKTESLLAQAENNSMKAIIESKKMHSLERLSSLELQAIKEDLLRQRDLMSKRLHQRTVRNKDLEKERENVHIAIQEEGKTLIKKCNSLRREGLDLVYKIGLAKKRAEELVSEIKMNFPNQKNLMKKIENDNNSATKIKKQKLPLPLEVYKSEDLMMRPKKLLDGQEDVEVQSSQQLLKYLMKEANKLYKNAEKNGDNIVDYQEKMNNFIVMKKT